MNVQAMFRFTFTRSHSSFGVMKTSPVMLFGVTALVSAGFGLSAPAAPPKLPEGYTLQYEQSFETKEGIEDFMMTDASAWELGNPDGNPALALTGESDYKPPYRSPLNIALIKDLTFGSFIMDVDIQQTGVRGVPIREYVAKHQDTSDSPGNAHRDFCFFFGFQDPARFLYIHVAKAGDNNAHQVFVVDESARTPITDFRTAGANWGLEEWRKIRIVRDLDKSTVEIFFQDMLTPIMIADEVPFEWGFVGFGSFDDTGYVDNIKIWAPESRASEQSFFE